MLHWKSGNELYYEESYGMLNTTTGQEMKSQKKHPIHPFVLPNALPIPNLWDTALLANAVGNKTSTIIKLTRTSIKCTNKLSTNSIENTHIGSKIIPVPNIAIPITTSIGSRFLENPPGTPATIQNLPSNKIGKVVLCDSHVGSVDSSLASRSICASRNARGFPPWGVSRGYLAGGIGNHSGVKRNMGEMGKASSWIYCSVWHIGPIGEVWWEWEGSKRWKRHGGQGEEGEELHDVCWLEAC